MIRPQVYCTTCNKRVDYRLESSVRDLEHKGVPFSFLETRARCVECGNLVYVPGVNDCNVKERHKAYYNARYAMEELRDNGVIN